MILFCKVPVSALECSTRSDKKIKFILINYLAKQCEFNLLLIYININESRKAVCKYRDLKNGKRYRIIFTR